MKLPRVLAFLLVFSASLSCTCDGHKVLVFPIDGSHWLNMKILVEALHSKGHDITVLRSSQSWYISEVSPFYTSITIQQEQSYAIESQSDMNRFMTRSLEVRQNRGSLWAFVEFYRMLFDLIRENQAIVAQQALSILENKTLTQQLENAAYDVFLTDPVFPAGVLLGHYLKLPMVFNVRWIFNGDGHFSIAPSPLSYIPQLFSQFTDKMGFFERVSNVIYHSILLYMRAYVSNPPYQAVCDKYFGPEVNVLQLMQGADLWLMRVDFTFELPRPTMPNVVYIGGFQGKPAKPLPDDLEEFMQSSGEHGVIIMTLGTLLGDLGSEYSQLFASAFANLPQKVIWRHIGEKPASLGNNTRLVEWMPQNDILGHPKTKLFVTHGGTNGLYEALHHGVPVLGVPLIFDQFDNMVRMKAKGVGDFIELTQVDVETLTDTLRNILDPQAKYKQNMVKLSQLHLDKPIEPLENAVFWIEYVARHKGAAHLRTDWHKLPWYSYYCVDVLAFLVAVISLVVAVLITSCRWLVHTLMRKKKSTVKSKHE
ncbi:UDP-glucuronosyltransferase 2A2-like isoform 1-T2 [Synchiropus picturatus]